MIRRIITLEIGEGKANKWLYWVMPIITTCLLVVVGVFLFYLFIPILIAIVLFYIGFGLYIRYKLGKISKEMDTVISENMSDGYDKKEKIIDVDFTEK